MKMFIAENESWIRDRVIELGYRFRLLPHKAQLYSALKIHEFHECLMRLEDADERVLIDVCCGEGLQSQLLARRGFRVIGVDRDEKKIRDALWHLRRSSVRENVSFILGDAESMDLPSEICDVVISLCAIEHIERPLKALKEMTRLLKPGGILCVSADSLGNVNDKVLLRRHKNDYDVKRYYTPESLSSLLSDAGLLVRESCSILKSATAVDELVRCMDSIGCQSLLMKYLLLRRIERADARNPEAAPGLFVIAVGSKLV